MWLLSPVLLLVASTLQAFEEPQSIPVRSYAALGDSYASGGGAGSSRWIPKLDPFCGRFSDAYPVQVANNTGLQIKVSAFKNLACGGSTSTSVLKNQVPWIGQSDIVTITVGGNEVDFFLLLNECVQQWHPVSSCETEIIKARRLMEAPDFLDNFEKMVVGTMKKLIPGAALLVTGYARFFNAETAQCDHITFSRTNPENFLTRDLRRQLNQLVDVLNNVIKAVSDAHGAIYVDIDAVFEGHRFCEEGVIEPTPFRTGTWFFNIDYDDSSSSGLLQQKGVIADTFRGPVKDFLDLVRTFHPTGLGHEAIAQEIVRITLQR